MQPIYIINLMLHIVLRQIIVLTAKKREDLVILPNKTQVESYCMRVQGNPVMKSILITSHFQIGMSIS